MHDLEELREKDFYAGDINHPVVVLAEDNLDKLTEKQVRIWDHFFGGREEILPIEKSDIRPEQLQEFLPNFWMLDMIYDGEALKDLHIRLLGTNMSEMLGERTGENIISNAPNAGSLCDQRYGVYRRARLSAELMIKEQKPVLYYSKFFSAQKKYYQSTGLVIPVKNKSSRINLMLGNTEITRNAAADEVPPPSR